MVQKNVNKNQLTNTAIDFIMKKDIKRWWERGVHTDNWKRMTFTGWEMSPEHVVWKVAFEPSRRTCLLYMSRRTCIRIMRRRIFVYRRTVRSKRERFVPVTGQWFLFQWIMELKNRISRDMLFLQHNKGGTALTRPLHPYGCEGLFYFA